MFTGNYQQDVRTARQLNLFTGINPKKAVLEELITDYLSTTNTESDVNESQKISEIALLDELINACNDSTESDTEKDDRSSLLPRPMLRRDRVKKPAPILKRDRIVTVDPLKRPTSKPIKLSDRKLAIAPKPKLSKPNRSLFQ
jgi:hypothetical protein